jgi:hypothetical protein
MSKSTLPYVRFFHRFEESSLATGGPWSGSKHWQSVPTVKLAQFLSEIIEEFIARASLEPRDEIASGWFLREISHAVAALHGMVQRQLDSWKPLAHKAVQWPMLATLNPRITQSQKQFLRSLELGRDAFLSMNLRSRTSTEDAATRYALSILLTLNDNRDSWADSTDPNAPQWAKNARKLPTFNKRTWHRWWLAGKQAFSEVVHHPEEIEELKKLARTKETAAEKRALILERIARAMKSLAPT